jgi:ABC-type sugar transport system ATPase subunit
MVFQSYALYPHKTVRDNLAFGLQVRRVAEAEIEARVSKVANMLGLETLLARKPAQLSGGQRQRIALGRAIVREPQAFLLDEPLSNLDPLLRASTRSELALLHRQLATTMVYVTHDQEEAMTLGSRIAVMRDGAIEQLDAPRAVYDEPANTFVAQFVGSPAMNLWDSQELQSTLAGAEAGRVVGVRPHDIELVEPEAADIAGRIVVVEPLGAATLIHVRADEPASLVARAVVPADMRPAVDERVGLRLRRDRLHLFDAATGRRCIAAHREVALGDHR